MKKIFKFCYSFVYNPYKRIKKDENEILELKVKLEKALLNNDPLEGLIEMFNCTSNWQDGKKVDYYIKELEKTNYGQMNLIVGNLKILKEYLQKLKRKTNGINRAKRLEDATEMNIWLGNVNALPVKSIFYWRSQDEMEPAICDQAQNFIQRNAHTILSVLNQLLVVSKW